ncbi:hypothetical protein PM082_013572 [Marasmius tenuissimus]|nr:hypothetical protein PM082_013572 [Marasmius tenuissimus]
MYRQATAALIARFGYDPPEAAPVEGKDYSVRDINTYDGQEKIDEEAKRDEYKRKLHKQITNFTQYHWRRKKVDVDGVTQVFLGVLDASGSAPRKPQERQFYMKQNYNDRFKTDFDSHWETLLKLGTVDPGDRIKEMNRYCEARWDEESEEFKDKLREDLDAQHKLELADHRDRGSWSGDAESYARMWRRANQILPSVVLSVAKLFGVGVSFLLWGPRADGKIHVDSISCQVPGSNTKKDLSEFDPLAYSAMHKACQDYANAVFPPSLCQSRVVEGGMGELESTSDLDSHTGHLFRSAPDGMPVAIGVDPGTAPASHSTPSTATPTSTNPVPLPSSSAPAHPGNTNDFGVPPLPTSSIANSSIDGSTPPFLQGSSGPPTFNFNNAGLSLSNNPEDMWHAWSKTMAPEQLADINMLSQHIDSGFYQFTNDPGNSAGDVSAMGGGLSFRTNDGFAVVGPNLNSSAWADNLGAPQAPIGVAAVPFTTDLQVIHDQSPTRPVGGSPDIGESESSSTNAPMGFSADQMQADQDMVGGGSEGGAVGAGILGGPAINIQADSAGEADGPPHERETLVDLPPQVQQSVEKPVANAKENSPKRKTPEQSAVATRVSKRKKVDKPDGSWDEGTTKTVNTTVAQGRERRERRVPQHLRGGGKGSYIVSPTKSDAVGANDNPAEGDATKGTKGAKKRKGRK